MSARAHILKPYDCCRLKNSSGACTRKWGPRRRWNLNSACYAKCARQAVWRFALSSKCSIISRTTAAGRKRDGFQAQPLRYFITANAGSLPPFSIFHVRWNIHRALRHIAQNARIRIKCCFPMLMNTWILYLYVIYHILKRETIAGAL